MKKRILIIASSANEIGPNNRATGSFLTEIAHPYQTFKQQGYDIDIASVTGGEAPLDGMFEQDEEINTAFLTGEGLEKMKHSIAISNVDVSVYDAVFVPGGLAPMVDMPENQIVQAAIASTYERGAVVGAVCHGPVSLLNVKLSNGTYLINGKNITAFSNAEEEHYAQADVPFMLETALRERGANYQSAAPWQAHSIADGRLVTGQNPASAQEVAEKMIAILEAATPIHVFAKWQVKDGQANTVLNLLKNVVEQSTAEAGNLFYTVHQSNTDANTLMLFEGYQNDEALTAHRNSEHFKTVVVGQIVPLLENREVILASELGLS